MTYSDEFMAHAETQAFEDGFQLAGSDPRDEADGDDWFAGFLGTEVDDQPDYVWRNPRISERTDVARGRQVYTILCDDGQEVELKALIAKLNKKLGKWGQTIDIVAEEEITKDSWLTSRRGFFLDANGGRYTLDAENRFETVTASAESEAAMLARGYKKRTIRQVMLTIESPAVAGKKTKLIGSFELAEDGVEVYRHALNGASEADIAPFLARWKDCDHCGFKRDRRASFVCEDENGERAVIGRQCSRDFLGLDAAELLAREAIRKALSTGGEDEDGGGGGFGSRYIHVESLVLKAYLVAKRLGGYSRDTRDVFLTHVAALEGARDYGRSTFYADLRREYQEWAQKAKPEPLDFVKLADYIFGMGGDYGYNLQIAFSCEYAKPKRRTLIASGVGIFIGKLAAQTRAKAADTRPPAKHLPGKVGDRLTFVAYVERTIPMRSDFGPRTLVIMRGDDGEAAVHFHTGDKASLPEPEKRYAVKATIKKHGENRRSGEPETVLTRAVYEPASEHKLL